MSKNNFIALVVFGFGLLLCSCSEKAFANVDANAESAEEKNIQAVRVQVLEKTDLRKFIELNGNVRAEKSMSVYPVMAGKITGSPVHLGSKVKKGSVISYVDPSLPGARYALNAVTAPISGTIISIPLKEGTRVSTETAVAVIGDLSKLQIITYVPERYVSSLKASLDAEITLEAFEGETFLAHIGEISPVLDEASRTKEVVLNFDKSDNRVNAGMFAGIKLFLKDYSDVFSVPTSCIIEKDGKKYVYIASLKSGNDKTFFVRLVEITSGEEIQDRSIIEFVNGSGDSFVGEKVVVQGFESLQDGSLVNIAE